MAILNGIQLKIQLTDTTPLETGKAEKANTCIQTDAHTDAHTNATHACGHFGFSSSHVCLLTIQPNPGKKSVRQSRSTEESQGRTPLTNLTTQTQYLLLTILLLINVSILAVVIPGRDAPDRVVIAQEKEQRGEIGVEVGRDVQVIWEGGGTRLTCSSKLSCD